MALSPPRKRQRRQHVVVSSEDDETGKDVAVKHDDESRVNSLDTRVSGKKDGTDASADGNKLATASFSSSSSFPSAGRQRSQAQTQSQTKLPASLSPKSPRTRPRSAQSSATGATSSSPEKRRTRKKQRKQEPVGDRDAAATTTPTTPRKDVEKTKSLRAFFQPATEEQRWDRTERSLPNTKAGGKEEQQFHGWEEEDDLIEDDGLDEVFEGIAKNGCGDNNGVGWGGREAIRSTNNLNGRVERRRDKTSGKKFILPTSHGSGPDFTSGGENNRSFASSAVPSSLGSSARPWAEEFAPANLDELAVHKKKTADVQNWLVNVFSGKSKHRILVLRGPAGSGKTTTVSLLSKVLGYDIVEWKNSTGAEYFTQGYMSMGAQFDDFLGRSDKFSTLETDDEWKHQTPQAESADSGSQRRVILVEEFPTSLSPGSSGLLAFRTALQRYLAATVPLGSDRLLRWMSPSSSPPIIVVVSETLLGTGSSLADNLTVHRLLGPEISNHPGVSIIEFNRVAPTFISKALDLVLKKEARLSKRRRVPGPAVLKRISEMGDIRSAISSLEFLCLRGDDSGGSEGWSGTLASRLKRPGKTGIRSTAMENESLEMVTQREASLGIFHAVGKVMYNKRDVPAMPSPQGAPEANHPPIHLKEYSRPRPPQVSVEDLMSETGTDIQTFVAALHENYVLSCSGSTFSDSLEGCICALSDADILSGETRRGYRASRGGAGSARPSFQGYDGTIDVLRQEEISFQAAVRGLLFSLPSPVKRRAMPGTRAGDAHKMFFPTSLRLWRDNEELDGLLNVWIRRLTTPSPSGSAGPASRTDGVESWKSRLPFSNSSSDGGTGEQTQSAVAARALISRDEVLLERLPYMSRLTQDPSDLKQLEKLTKFRGIVEQSDDLLDDDVDNLEGSAVVKSWATDKPSRSPRKQRVSNSMTADGSSTEPVEDVVDKLILSDDDIED